MPGRQPATRSGPIHRRARTGCNGCRTRKIKCDETKPVCRNCSSRNLACGSGLQLKWLEEFETRGVAFGRQGVWTKDSARGSSPASPPRTVTVPSRFLPLPIFGPQHFLHTSSSDFEPSGPAQCDPVLDANNGCCVSSPGRRVVSTLRRSDVEQSVIIRRSPSPFVHLRGHDMSLLEYYLGKLCPLTTSSRRYPSPFASLIMPLFTAPGQEDVLRSLLALSARHWSRAEPRWDHTAMSLKGSVLASLQRRLAISDRATLDTLPQILIQMMFLCLYEIVDKCDHRWVIHLRASQDIIRGSKALGVVRSQRHADGLTAFVERFFAFQDAISRTACVHAPLFDMDYWDSLPDRSEIDPWMGCSMELAGILYKVTELGRVKNTGSIPGADFFERAGVLESRIASLASSTWARDDADLASSAELKRLAASLYLHCVLYDASPSTEVVSRLVRIILGKIHQLIRKGDAKTLAFPLFTAAVELDPRDDIVIYDPDRDERIHGRRLVLEALDVMATDSLSNITRTKAVIQKVWRLRDLHVEDQPAPPKHRAANLGRANDWSTFVGPISSYVCLA